MINNNFEAARMPVALRRSRNHASLDIVLGEIDR
jgi:hypothetical protein